MIVAAALMAAAVPSVAELRHQRRVLIVAAASAADPRLAAQRHALASWHKGAADRDVTVVEVIGNHVTGARDPAATLRRAHRLDPQRFTVVLIGKDGHEALRSSEPLLAERLQGTIDAMPMRRAGQR